MLYNYNGKQVTFTWGSIVASGFADGSFITVDRNEDDYMLHVGTDGHGTRARSNNRSGTITVRLAQSSATNDAYSAQARLAETGVPSAGVLPAVLRDGSGRTLVQAQSCWIQKRPPLEFGREASEWEWTFASENLDIIVGGN